MVTATEFIGFIAPALAGGTTTGTAALALLAAGAVEGAMLGWGQATVLRGVLPGLRRPQWIIFTAAGAVVAYLTGLTPSTAHDAGLPLALFIPVVVVAGVVLLLSPGVGQWLVLRHLVQHAERWVFATAGAWMLGLAVFLGFTMPLWQSGQPPLIVTTAGSCTRDAVQWVEAHNRAGNRPDISLWSVDEIEALLRKWPAVMTEFRLAD